MASPTKHTLSASAWTDLGSSPCDVILQRGATKLHYASTAPATVDGTEAFLVLTDSDPAPGRITSLTKFSGLTGHVYGAALPTASPDEGPCIVIVVRD
jgi:hypothetical protein